MRMSRTITLEGFDELISKLSNPRLSEEPIGELLEEASKLGERASMQAIDGGTGLAVRSINRKVWKSRMTARVYTLMSRRRAMSIEKGRVPGEGESIERLAAWYKKIPYRGRIHITPQERSTVIAIWKAVRHYGVKGKAYMIAARASIESELPKLMNRAMIRLKELARR